MPRKRLPPPALATKESALEYYRQGGYTVLRGAKLAGCSYPSFRWWLDEYGIPRDRSQRKAAARVANPDWQPEVEFPDRREFPENTDDIREKYLAWHDAVRQWDIQQDTATVRIDTDLPIGICQRGDWHIGNEHTDLRTFIAHERLILATPGLYSFENGDLQDGYIEGSKMTGVHEALQRPRTQRHFVWDALKRLRGRVLGLTKGQHDAWSVKTADFDPVEWVAHDYEIPYLGHGGLLTLEVGETTYTMHVRHKGKYNSIFNATHSIKQAWRFFEDSDIGVHADKHTPAVELVEWKGAVRLAMRPGSYKPSDDFSQSLGFMPARPIMPIVILWPNERRFEAHWCLEWGAEALTRIRRALSER